MSACFVTLRDTADQSRLIDKDYMERDEEGRNVYNYVA